MNMRKKERERERHRRRGHMVKKDGSFIFSARLYISLYRFCIDIRVSLKRSRNLSLVLRVSSHDKHRCICILLTNERFIDLAPFCSARIFISDKTLRPTTTRIVTAVSFTTVVCEKFKNRLSRIYKFQSVARNDKGWGSARTNDFRLQSRDEFSKEE